MYVCVYIYIYIHIYMHTQTYTSSGVRLGCPEEWVRTPSAPGRALRQTCLVLALISFASLKPSTRRSTEDRGGPLPT